MADKDLGRHPSGRATHERSPQAVSAVPVGIPDAWPLCGYAPGNYMGRCHDCGQQWEGQDKRAWQCLECAAQSANSAMEKGLRALHALRLFREFATRNATQWLIGANDHHHPIYALMAELLPSDDIRSGNEWRFIQPENRLTLEQLASGTEARQGGDGTAPSRSDDGPARDSGDAKPEADPHAE